MFCMLGVDVGSGIAGFLIMYLLMYLVIFAISVVSYILNALGLYTVAKRRELKNPWMAWVPILDSWILGSISDQYQYVTRGKIRNKRKWLLGIQLAFAGFGVIVYIMTALLSFYLAAGGSLDLESPGAALIFGSLIALIFVVLMGLSITMMIFYYLAVYDLYKSCDPGNAVLFLVLGVVMSAVTPFFVFAVRKKDGGMPPRRPGSDNRVHQQNAEPAPAHQPQPACEPPEVPPVPVEEAPAEPAAAEDTPEEIPEEIPEETIDSGEPVIIREAPVACEEEPIHPVEDETASAEPEIPAADSWDIS